MLKSLLFASNCGRSRSWISTLNGVQLSSSAATSAAAYYVGTYGYDGLILKATLDGATLSGKSLGGAATDQLNACAGDASGNLVVAGLSSGSIYVAKLSSSLAVTWQRSLGGAGTDQCNGCAVDAAGNIYVVGYTLSEGQGNSDAYVAKYSAAGALLWQNILGGVNSDRFNSCAVDASGDLYAVGLTGSDGQGGGDILVVKYNAAGTLLWQRILGKTLPEEGFGCTVDTASNLYITGCTLSVGQGAGDAVFAKYSPTGTLLWQRTLGGVSLDRGNSCLLDPQGNLLTIGTTSSSGRGLSDILVAQYTPAGVCKLQRTLGSTFVDQGASCSRDPDGNLYIAGYYDSNAALAARLAFTELRRTVRYTNAFRYRRSLMTESAGTLLDAAGTLTPAAATLTSAAATLTLGTVAPDATTYRGSFV